MTPRFELHGLARSAPTYVVTLMLRLCGEKFDYVHVDLAAGKQRTPQYLDKNRFGVVPTLVDHNDGHSYLQSSSILQHLSDELGKFNGANKREQTQIREWMYWNWDRLAPNLYRSRGLRLGVRQFGFEAANMYFIEGNSALKVLNEHLNGRDFIVGNVPTIADIAIYGVVVFAQDGGFDLKLYPAIVAWMAHITALPNYVAPGKHLPMESVKGI